MLRSHARNENEFQTPGHRWLLAKHWDAWFLNSSKSKLIWNSWKLACYHGAASTCHGTKFVPFGEGLGICFSQTRASHNKHDGFGTERPNFEGEAISIASNCFQIFSHVNIEQLECCVIFCDFSGFVWTFLCIKWVFNAFMCIIQIWTTCTCPDAYKLVEKSNLWYLGARFGPMQEMGMNVKHPATVTRPQTLRYLVFKF